MRLKQHSVKNEFFNVIVNYGIKYTLDIRDLKGFSINNIGRSTLIKKGFSRFCKDALLIITHSMSILN